MGANGSPVDNQRQFVVALGRHTAETELMMMVSSPKKKLTPDDFHTLAAKLGQKPFRARKTGLVAARPAKGGERIETRWNGVETVNKAEAGDWVVTSLAKDGSVLRDDEGCANSYVITGDHFPKLYAKARGAKATAAAMGGAAEFGEIFRAAGVIQALHLHDGFDILAPWGERQRADRGYLLLRGDEVYGNHVDTFGATYRRI